MDVDFEIVDYTFIPDEIWKVRFRDMTPEQIAEVSRNFNNVYNELHLKMMVIKDAGRTD